MDIRFEFAPEMVAKANERRDMIAEYSPARAEKWYRGLFEKIETLKTLPTRCPVAPESEAYGEELRYLTYGKRSGIYRIFFTIRGDVIRIVALHHGARGSIDF
jgi:plasmid stabilization system protein ParE